MVRSKEISTIERTGTSLSRIKDISLNFNFPPYRLCVCKLVATATASLNETSCAYKKIENVICCTL